MLLSSFVSFTLLLTTVVGIEKFRRFYIDEKISTRLVLRCPLAWSEEDSITFFHLKDNGDVLKLSPHWDSRDSLLLELIPESKSSYYQCWVNHKKDNLNETVNYYIDRKPLFKDIQKLKYSLDNTTIKEAKLGESLVIKCQIEEKNSNNFIWFGPDLLQLNNSVSVLEIKSVQKENFGEYFCGLAEDVKDSVLIVGKTVVKSSSLVYKKDLLKAAKLLSYPVFKLGEPLIYNPASAYTLTRRLIWEYPPKTILLNQGRDFYMETFTHDLTQEEFYYRESDRMNPKHTAAKKILFQSRKMGRQSFGVEITPNPASVIIGASIELFCNNTHNFKAIWYFKNSTTSSTQDLPSGVSVRIEGPYTIATINSSLSLHSGTYVCNAKKGTSEVALTVLPSPKLAVSPTEVVIRPGTSARFLCQLIDAVGKVIWRRKDKKSFQMDVESRIGGDTQAILVIESSPKELNGSIYECIHNEMVVEALLMVKDLCPPNKRSCRNGDCIDESLFCNGVKDCPDVSDEDVSTCAQCEPNQKACLNVHNKSPTQKCVVRHWFCDGDNDCGNGYDELNCPKIDTNTCLSTHFACNDNQTLIPRSLWCDKTVNCPNGDDEINCRDPEVIIPNKETTYGVHINTSVSLTCEVVSVPTSTINWRYNWGTLPQKLNFTITQTGSDCNRIRNTLTIYNMHPDFAGVYTCEAVSSARAMAKDYTLFVTSTILCKRPYFNNAAWLKDMCLKCFCSNVTDDCTSAKGYFQSPTSKVSVHTRAYLMNFMTKKILETGNTKSLFDSESKIYKFYDQSYKSLVVNPNMYLVSKFGLSGSWLDSYSFYMTITMKLTGLPLEDMHGPVAVIKGSNGKSLHWCRSDDSQAVYSSDNGYVNTLKLSLWEKENWYNNIACTASSTREDFLNVLTHVSQVLVRIKYYTNQTGFELHNITLEYVIPASRQGESSLLVPKVEMCNCPFPYAGLSCEKCVDGYKKDSKNKCIKSCPMNCEECQEKGECIKCKGYRSGPQCLQCKPGFIRRIDRNMNENCVECPCKERFNKAMIGDECGYDLSVEGKIECKCTGREVNDGLCDKCLQIPLLEENKKLCVNRTVTKNPSCNKYGTEEISDERCKCKIGYKGEFCTECDLSYFPHDGKCLKCFCSNITEQCRASTDYKFVNLTLNSEDYKLDISLTKRLLSGVYDADSSAGYLKINRTDNKIIVKRNPNGVGLVYVSITAEDTSNPQSINTYTMMYGGKIKFKFEYITDKLNQLFYNDVTPFLEIESKKIGRLWIPLTYNDDTKTMEVKLTEDCFPSWKLDKDGSFINRELFIRALMTAQYLSIGFPFDNDIVKKVQISQLTIEHARKAEGPGIVAPVEVCPCKSNTMGIKCEECNKPGFRSEMTLSSNMPDFVCGKCTSPSCKKCADGTYNYDFILNKNFSTCQPGIEITTKGRVIQAYRGESLSIPCSVKSYKGGIAVHKWIKKDSNAQHSTFRHLSSDGQSNLVLNFDEIKLSDSGYYICTTKNAISNSSEEFSIVVIDKPARLKVDIFVLSEGKKKVQYNVSIASPKSSTDYKVIWSVVKDGKTTTEESFKVKVSQEKSQYKIDLEITTNITDGMQLRGLVVGGRVTNPFQYEIRHNIKQNLSIQIDDVKVSINKNVLNLKFMESGVIGVKTSPNIRTETFWYKVNINGTETELPQGITRRENELVIWSASENHSGKYVGYVINSDDGTKIGKVYTEINVSPMIPIFDRELFNVTKISNISIRLYVPSNNYCPNQSWELHNVKSAFPIDITKNVTRISDKEVIISYPLNLGDLVRFRCFVILDANLTGEIKINIESKYPIVDIVRKYVNSSLPTSLVCEDKNIAYSSNITWFFKDKPIGNGDAVDWTNLGGFSPHFHEGLYICFAQNIYNNVTKSVFLPETRTGIVPGYIKIVSSTNPKTVENGTIKFYVEAGQRFQVGAVIVGLPPLGTKIEWFINNNTVEPTQSGNFFSNIDILVTSTKTHYGTYKVQIFLPNKTIISKTFEVIPHKQLTYYAKIDGLNPNGDLSILEGDSQVIGCKFITRENGKEIENTNVKIDWKFIDSIGGSWTIADIPGLKGNSEYRLIDISNAQRFLNRFRGQCEVTFNGIMYQSKFFSFDVNQKNIDHRVRLIGLDGDKYVSNDEDGTSKVICQAYDETSKKVLPNAEYTWKMTYNSQNRTVNWKQMNINGDTITFGGLVYQKLENSAVGKCEVNYFGQKFTSNEFTFKIQKKDLSVNLPKIKIEITYDSKRPPYPISVGCQVVKGNDTSNLTLTVSNPNFERVINRNTTGWLLINFTEKGTEFNPYKDSGLYTFKVRNPYGYKEKQILLPQYQNPNRNYTANIVVYSTTGNIENNRIRVKANSELKLLCVYYGYPNPLTLKWISKKIDSSNVHLESFDYWTSITIKDFNPEINGGEYECHGKSHQGILLKKLMVEGYAYGIKVDLYDKNGIKMLKKKTLEQGDNFVISYRATDLFTNSEVKNLNGSWEFRFLETDNFTEISPLTFPREQIKFEGMKMTISDVARSGRLEIRCKFQNKSETFISESVVLSIIENKELHPEPHFIVIHANESIYPSRLRCIDTSSISSKLIITKIKGFNNTELRLETKPKEVDFVWAKRAFSPYHDLGTYQCTAIGKYQNQTISIVLPEENDRILNTYVKFESRINTITFKKKEKILEVVDGKKFMIFCNYYGSRHPLTDIEIVLESKSGESQSPANFATKFLSKSYFAEVSVDKFDSAKHSGIYTCRTRNKTYEFIDKIAVKGVKPGLEVSVYGLDSDKSFKLTLGSTITLKCHAVDAISKNLVRNIKYDWKLETLKGGSFEIDDLAEMVKKKDGSITLTIIKPSEDLRGRCEATGKTGTFQSEYFDIKMIQDGKKKPKLEFIEIPGNEERGFPISLSCTDESKNDSDTKITRLSGPPPGVTYNKTKNSIELIFPKDISNPLLYVGAYRCDGVNKYGIDWKVVEVTYKQKIKPLMVAIESNDIAIVTKMGMKTIEIQEEKRIELDCIYSGDNQPIVANWFFKENSELIKLEKEKATKKFVVFQKRSDCLSIVHPGFTEKTNISLSCIVQDVRGTLKSDSVEINSFIVGTVIVITGLDNGTKTVAKQGSERILTCKVLDLTTEKDISKNFTIIWIFTDEKGQKVELNDLANNVVYQDGNLKLGSLKNSGKILMGNCVVNNGTTNLTSTTFKYIVKEDEDKKPKLHFSENFDKNKKFPTSLNCTDSRNDESSITVSRADGKPIPKEWIKKLKGSTVITFPNEEKEIASNEGLYTCRATNNYGSDEASLQIMIRELLSLSFNSTINKIVSDQYGNLSTIVRKNRKLELNCYVTGIPTPKVKISIITEGYRPDLPVPSRKSELVPGDMNSAYQVNVISEKHYRLSRPYYSQSPPSSFSCEATLGNETILNQIKVEEVLDLFKVNIISQNNQLNQIAFLDKPFKIGCEMRDNANALVKMQSIKWTFQNQTGENIELSKLAKKIKIEDNKIILEGLTLEYGNLIRGRCVAYYNETYDTLSDEFNLNIKESPKITRVYVEFLSPNNKSQLNFPMNYTYNAMEMTEFKCKADSTNDIKPSIQWVKCLDDFCNSTEKAGTGNALVFFPDSTKYTNVGEYRCVAKLSMDGNVITEVQGVLNIGRKAAPKNFSTLNIEAQFSIILTCDNVNSSPEGNLTWSFIPNGKTIEEALPIAANVKTQKQISTLTVIKPLKPEYSGTYICKTVNEYGSGGRRFNVKVSSITKRKIKF